MVNGVGNTNSDVLSFKVNHDNYRGQVQVQNFKLKLRFKLIHLP